MTLRIVPVANKNWRSKYLRLHPQAALKRLEQPYVYHIARDELYEIDDRAEDFLSRCNGTLTGADLTSEDEFVEYCFAEGLLDGFPAPEPLDSPIGLAPQPSLRYLELQMVHRCNLYCRHCYLGDLSHAMLPLEDAISITREFASRGGLRLMISGGEPLLYPHLKEFITETADLKLRRILLTNGTLINADNISWLSVENIQFSLDGWRQGHELLRGKGTFERTRAAIQTAKDAGISVSVATMIHRGNMDEFDRLQSFIDEIEAAEWDVDVLCEAGSLTRNHDVLVSYEQAAPLLRYAFGGGYHGPSDGFACGRHLLTVLPSGAAVKCGFYEDRPLGDARNGLIDCWLRLEHVELEKLDCRGCPVIAECAGGCRFRAASPLAPDPVMCALHRPVSAS
jgi:radical SAM protein with 4Fe4S-binding SPASM domain